MNTTLDDLLRSWTFNGWLIASLLVTAAVYVRGWRRLAQRGSEHFGPWQPASFLAGLTTIFVALSSPLETFSGFLLQVHMLQHLLLMFAAPILIWCGAPQVPLQLGLPRGVLEYWVVPLLRQPVVESLVQRLTNPLIAWPLAVAMTWAWHVPALYELALASETWHYVEHACFFAAGLLFWWPVIAPYPSRPAYSRYVLLPYLFLAGIQGGVLSAVITFSDRVLYAQYADVPRLWGITALDDQAVAGALMWIIGSIFYLVALVWVAHGLLFESASWSLPAPRSSLALATATAGGVGRASRGHWPALGSATPPSGLPIIERLPAASPSMQNSTAAGPSRALDVLRWPLVGRLLRWPYSRRLMQFSLLLIAAVIVVDGFFGPQVAPLNLAGVLPWIHWRGLVVLGLLVAGNVFCMACPFMLPRAAARRYLPGRWHWPRALRSKWLAVALLLLFFWAYETFALWSSPWWTAWIAVGYFAAALAVDGLFRGASFCKYVCPIGQFQFFGSLISPGEVRVRDYRRCTRCATHDCIRGSDTARGCELHLFQPQKSGNMDCTFCLDCVHACPHDNVGILISPPGKSLLDDLQRSGVGVISRRFDLSALVLVLVFAAFANAAGMVRPIVVACDRWAAALGINNPGWLGGVLVLAMILGLIACTFLVAAVSRAASGAQVPLVQLTARFASALVPLGMGMWLAHYLFHLLSGPDAFVPAGGRFLADWGVRDGSGSLAACCCPETTAPWLLRLEILLLDAGLLGSLYAGYRIGAQQAATDRRLWALFLPWAAFMWLMFVWGIWILLEPMQMRGMI